MDLLAPPGVIILVSKRSDTRQKKEQNRVQRSWTTLLISWTILKLAILVKKYYVHLNINHLKKCHVSR